MTEKPAHWTYQEVEEEYKDSLFQGDILEPTDDLKAILKEIYPNYVSVKNVAFMVLTQTCDILRHSGDPCKADYINLAIVRHLDDVLFAILDKICPRIGEGRYLAKGRGKANELIDRILNQNEQGLGLFYLHHDTSVNIAYPSVALLQVSIAIQAHKHYDVLLAARTGQLKPEFRAKLGWLTGNLFSRVATKDWPPEERQHWTNKFLIDGDGVYRNPTWVSKTKHESLLKREGVQIKNLSNAEFEKLFETHKIKEPLDKAIDCVAETIKQVISEISVDKLDDIKWKLRSNSHFRAQCR